MRKLSFVEMSYHPMSSSLLQNRCDDQAIYLQKRKEYKFDGSPIMLDDNVVYRLNPLRFDFNPYNNINVGWKIHLNVLPQNVLEISDFLIQNGFHHKYFVGGDLKYGKVFTVYFGSWSKMLEQTNFISSSIGHLLVKPKAEEEIEIDIGITARFTVLRNRSKNILGRTVYSDDVYSQYGNFGICMKNETAFLTGKNKGKTPLKSKEEEIMYYEEIFNELVREFEEYFVDLKQAQFK